MTVKKLANNKQDRLYYTLASEKSENYSVQPLLLDLDNKQTVKHQKMLEDMMLNWHHITEEQRNNVYNNYTDVV
jgi:hypothetical protein